MAEITLARRLTLFDATMIVMGGIVGAGIFMNPAVVAQEVTSPAAALGAWAAGGVFALAGAFIYAELAARRPAVGGQYAYLREAFHPLVAFLYASLDEYHQTFTRRRTGSVYDSLIDASGAATALALIWFISHRATADTEAGKKRDVEKER